MKAMTESGVKLSGRFCIMERDSFCCSSDLDLEDLRSFLARLKTILIGELKIYIVRGNTSF